MAIQLRPEADLLIIELVDRVTLADLLELITRVQEFEARERRAPDRIVDLSRCALHLAVGYNDFPAFARARERAVPPNRFRSALVAPEPVHYGMVRMYHTVTNNPLIERALFRNLRDARAWIGQGEPRNS